MFFHGQHYKVSNKLKFPIKKCVRLPSYIYTSYTYISVQKSVEKKQKELHEKFKSTSQCKGTQAFQKKVPSLRHQSNICTFIITISLRCIEFQGPCYHLLMETPSYIQVIDYSHRRMAIDVYWSTTVVAISLILHPIPQKVIGMKPEAAKHKQFQ